MTDPTHFTHGSICVIASIKKSNTDGLSFLFFVLGLLSEARSYCHYNRYSNLLIYTDLFHSRVEESSEEHVWMKRNISIPIPVSVSLKLIDLMNGVMSVTCTDVVVNAPCVERVIWAGRDGHGK